MLLEYHNRNFIQNVQLVSTFDIIYLWPFSLFITTELVFALWPIVKLLYSNDIILIK